MLLVTTDLEADPLCPSLLQFVADGVFYAELNEMLTRELAEHGYSGVEVRVTPMRTEIIIRATRTQNVLGMEHYFSTCFLTEIVVKSNLFGHNLMQGCLQ